MFSLAGRLFSDLRQSMHDGTLEERIWAKRNRDSNPSSTMVRSSTYVSSSWSSFITVNNALPLRANAAPTPAARAAVGLIPVRFSPEKSGYTTGRFRYLSGTKPGGSGMAPVHSGVGSGVGWG